MTQYGVLFEFNRREQSDIADFSLYLLTRDDLFDQMGCAVWLGPSDQMDLPCVYTFPQLWDVIQPLMVAGIMIVRDVSALVLLWSYVKI